MISTYHVKDLCKGNPQGDFNRMWRIIYRSSIFAISGHQSVQQSLLVRFRDIGADTPYWK